MDSFVSQSLWCDATTFGRCSSTVLTYRSTIPSDCGCRVVHVVYTPQVVQHLHQVELEVTFLVTVWLSRYSEAADEAGYQGFYHHRRLLVVDGVGLRSLGEALGDHEVSVMVAAREADCYVDGCPLERGPHPWFAGHNRLRRCRSVGTTSQHHFLPGASNNFVVPGGAQK
jgi:hypothetical protein